MSDEEAMQMKLKCMTHGDIYCKDHAAESENNKWMPAISTVRALALTANATKTERVPHVQLLIFTFGPSLLLPAYHSVRRPLTIVITFC